MCYCGCVCVVFDGFGFFFVVDGVSVGVGKFGNWDIVFFDFIEGYVWCCD